MVTTNNTSRKTDIGIVVAILIALFISAYYFFGNSFFGNTVTRDNKKSEQASSQLVGAYVSIAGSDLLQSIRNNYSFGQYNHQLSELKKHNRQTYEKSDLVERVALDRELLFLTNKEKEATRNYEQRLELLVSVVQFLDSLKEEFSVQEFNAAQESLISGKTQTAYVLLAKLHEKFRVTLGGQGFDHAAQAVYLLGRINEDNLGFQKAYQYYRLAVKYDPENVKYLLAAGNAADNLALYRKATIYYEAALHDLRENSSVPKEKIKQLLIKLARVWESRANNEKAQAYQQQADALGKQGLAK